MSKMEDNLKNEGHFLLNEPGVLAVHWHKQQCKSFCLMSTDGQHAYKTAKQSAKGDKSIIVVEATPGRAKALLSQIAKDLGISASGQVVYRQIVTALLQLEKPLLIICFSTPLKPDQLEIIYCLYNAIEHKGSIGLVGSDQIWTRFTRNYKRYPSTKINWGGFVWRFGKRIYLKDGEVELYEGDGLYQVLTGKKL